MQRKAARAAGEEREGKRGERGVGDGVQRFSLLPGTEKNRKQIIAHLNLKYCLF